MKLTTSSPNQKNNRQPTPSHIKRSIQQNQSIYREENDKTFFSNCPAFIFKSCINQSTAGITERIEIIEDCQEQTNSLKRDRGVSRNQNKLATQNRRKQKICLSLKQKSSLQQTPQKKTNFHNQNKYYSENKKECPSEQLQSINPNLLTPKKKLDLEKHSKMKTEPIQQQKSILKLKESLKPSTNVITPTRTSLKQSINSNSKRAKLTLSNNFKSSISQQNINLQRSADESFLEIKKIETGLASNQVFIEESLMTEKMMNIYGDKSSSFMKQPSSNIVYYNRVMNNQAIWKHPVLIKDISKKQTNSHQKNISILRGLQDNQQSYNLPERNPNDVEARDEFIQRKFIGQYAKTIKTFNQSEQKQQNQSIVLEHGFPSIGQFPALIKNRGSIKDCSSQSEIIKRHYSSFGQDRSFNITRNRQYVSHPIEQDSFDSQKQN